MLRKLVKKMSKGFFFIFLSLKFELRAPWITTTKVNRPQVCALYATTVNNGGGWRRKIVCQSQNCHLTWFVCKLACYQPSHAMSSHLQKKTNLKNVNRIKFKYQPENSPNPKEWQQQQLSMEKLQTKSITFFFDCAKSDVSWHFFLLFPLFPLSLSHYLSVSLTLMSCSWSTWKFMLLFLFLFALNNNFFIFFFILTSSGIFQVAQRSQLKKAFFHVPK